MSATLQGIIFTLLGMTGFSLMNAGSKVLAGVEPVSVLLFFRFLISTIVMLPFAFRERAFIFNQQCRANAGWLLARIFMALLAIAFTFIAVRHTSLSNAAVLNGTAPLFIPLFMMFLLKQKSPPAVWFSLVLGYTGIVVVIHPGSLGSFNTGSIMALCAALCGSFVYVVMRKLGTRLPIVSILFYYYIVSTLVCGCFAVFQWKPVTSWHVWVLVLGVAVAGYLYQFTVNVAMVKASPDIVSPFLFSSVVFSGIIDWLVWKNVPDTDFIVGTIIIIISAILTLHFAKRCQDKQADSSVGISNTR